MVYEDEHPERRKVRKFWRVSANGTEIEEISEQEYQALQEKEEATAKVERLYQHEDQEDPTTNDRF